LAVNFSLVLEQQLHSIFIPSACSQVQRADVSLLGAGVRHRALFQEDFDYFLFPMLRSRVKRCPFMTTIFGVDSG